MIKIKFLIKYTNNVAEKSRDPLAEIPHTLFLPTFQVNRSKVYIWNKRFTIYICSYKHIHSHVSTNYICILDFYLRYINVS